MVATASALYMNIFIHSNPNNRNPYLSKFDVTTANLISGTSLGNADAHAKAVHQFVVLSNEEDVIFSYHNHNIYVRHVAKVSISTAVFQWCKGVNTNSDHFNDGSITADSSQENVYMITKY